MFVVIETVMNGSFTMSVGATAFDFSSFEKMVLEIKKRLEEMSDNDIDIIIDTAEEFCYRINQQFPVIGITKNVHMEINE